MALLLRIFFCIFVVGLCLFYYVDGQNKLTALRIRIPPLEKRVRKLHGDNSRLEYEIDRFESPLHLMELASKPEYSHLRHPYFQDIIILADGREEGSGSGAEEAPWKD